MTDKPFLAGYSGQSLGQLIDLEGHYRMDSLVLALEDALLRKRDREGDENLSDEEFVVLSVEALEREVNNGGYDQYFFNSANLPDTAGFIRRIVADLRRIGCEETARITEQAVASLDLPALDAVAILDRLVAEDDRLDEALEDLANAYYAAAEDIAGKLFDFAKQNKESFNIP